MVPPRDTMPSLHAVWVALMAMIAWRLPVAWRWPFLGVGGLTLLATVSAGHWFVDIVPSDDDRHSRSSPVAAFSGFLVPLEAHCVPASGLRR